MYSIQYSGEQAWRSHIVPMVTLIERLSGEGLKGCDSIYHRYQADRKVIMFKTVAVHKTPKIDNVPYLRR